MRVSGQACYRSCTWRPQWHRASIGASVVCERAFPLLDTRSMYYCSVTLRACLMVAPSSMA
jgi:hypothetical protein